MTTNAPSYYEYLGFDVRRFRSKFNTVSLGIQTNATALPSNLASKYSMELVSDYTWETVMHSTNAYDVGIFVNQTQEYLGASSTEFGDNKDIPMSELDVYMTNEKKDKEVVSVENENSLF